MVDPVGLLQCRTVSLRLNRCVGRPEEFTKDEVSGRGQLRVEVSTLAHVIETEGKALRQELSANIRNLDRRSHRHVRASQQSALETLASTLQVITSTSSAIVSPALWMFGIALSFLAGVSLMPATALTERSREVQLAPRFRLVTFSLLARIGFALLPKTC